VKRISNVLSPFAILAALSLPAHGAAGTSVTSGALMFASGVGVIDIAGQSDFRLRSPVDSTSGRFDAAFQCSELDCGPGTVVSLFAAWFGNNLSGTLRFKGHSYALGSESADGALGRVQFDGSVTLPPFNTSGTIDIDVPISLSGQIQFNDTGAVEPLTGTGIATIQFKRSPDGSAWQFSNATYALTK
jgi:hypothetical protein